MLYSDRPVQKNDEQHSGSCWYLQWWETDLLQRLWDFSMWFPSGRAVVAPVGLSVVEQQNRIKAHFISSSANNIVSPVAWIQGRKPTKRTAATLTQMIRASTRMWKLRRARVNQAAPATDLGHHQIEWQQHGQQTVALTTPGVGQTSSAWMRKMALSLWIILRDKEKCIPMLRLTTRTPAMLKHGTIASLNQVKQIGHASLVRKICCQHWPKRQCLCSFEQCWLINYKRINEEKSVFTEVAFCLIFFSPAKLWWICPSWQLSCSLTIPAAGCGDRIVRAKAKKFMGQATDSTISKVKRKKKQNKWYKGTCQLPQEDWCLTSPRANGCFTKKCPPLSSMAEHGVTWHAVSLWSIGVSCWVFVPSQLLAYPQTIGGSTLYGGRRKNGEKRENLSTVQVLLSSNQNTGVSSMLF